MWTLRILKEPIKYQTIGGFLFRLFGISRRSEQLVCDACKREFTVKAGDYVILHKADYEKLVSDADLKNGKLPIPHVSGSLLERAMMTLDDYLNAGNKESRTQAAENAKYIYKEYYGVDYVNRNDR